MFATRATVHTTLQATPCQLVFGRDTILNTQFDANWKLIKQRKQEMIKKNNQRENSTRIPHEYKPGDKVLLRRDDKAKFKHNPYDGPYEVVRANDNGTVVMKKGAVTETINIRLLKPYNK